MRLEVEVAYKTCTTIIFCKESYADHLVYGLELRRIKMMRNRRINDATNNLIMEFARKCLKEYDLNTEVLRGVN